MSRRLLTAGLIATFAAILAIDSVLAVPPIPYRPFGTVKLDGENVVTGTLVEVFCGTDPTAYGWTTSIEFSGDSVYAVDVLGDDPETSAKEGCLPGDTVRFTIGHPDGAISANETATWTSGASVEINLSAELPWPEIAVKKFVNGQDANVAPGPYIVAGTTVTWTYAVSNIGNVALSDVNLVDDNGTPGSPGDDISVCTFDSLNPATGQLCELTGPATAGPYANHVTASAFYTRTMTAVDSSHYFGALVAVDLEKQTNGQDADSAPGVYVAAGQLITWTYSVDNTGNVPLANLDVVDDNGTPGVPGDDIPICSISNLAPADAPVSCSVSSGAAVSGQYGNVATVSGTPPGGLAAAQDTDASHYFGVETGISLAKKTEGEDADAPPGPYVLAGSVVNWVYTIQNDGNVQLANILVTDNLVSGIDCQGVSELAPGEQMTCTASGTAIEGQYVNLGTVIGAPPGGLDVVSDTNSSHYFGARPEIQIETDTNDQDADSPSGVYIGVGEAVTWTYTISNTGNVNLANATITDDNGTPGIAGDDVPICTITNMAPEDTPVSCTIVGTAEPGQYANVGTVEASPPRGLAVVSDQDPSHYFGAQPAMELRKSTNGQDADSGVGPVIQVGDPITWTFNLSNTGNVPLTGITVTDDQLGLVCEFAALAPGDTPAMCIAKGTAVPGQYANVGVVEGLPPGGLAPVMDEDASHYYGSAPAIDLEKSTNGQDADSGNGPFILVGQPVTWTFSIDNTGNISLTNVTVTDNRFGPICEIETLAPDDPVVTCTSTGAATAGQHTNLGTVEGFPLGALTKVTDSDPSHYYGANPGVSLEKSTNQQDADGEPGPYILAGDPVTWTYTINNTGNVDVVNAVVSDDHLGTVCEIGSLAVNDPPVSCSAAGIARPGQYGNVGRVYAVYGSSTISETDGSHYYGTQASIDLEKHTNGHDADAEPGPYILAGDVLTWTYRVTNTGNVALTSITITDDGGTPAVPGDDYSCDFSELLPGRSKSCQSQGLAQVGQYANTATARGTPPGGLYPVSDIDVSHYFGSLPSISLEKRTNDMRVESPPGPYVPSGDPVTWTYNISNTGNVELSLVSVSDDQVLFIECPAQDSLAAEESIVCQANGVAGVGQYGNIGSVLALPPGGLDEISDSDASFYFGAAPGIALKKLTNGQDAAGDPGPYVLVGDTVTWTFVITNTGNVTLTDIISTDDNGTPDFEDDDLVTPDLGPLAAQASTTYEFTGTVQAGTYTNEGSVRAKPIVGNAISARSTSGYFGAIINLDIRKYTNGHDAPSAPGPTIEASEPVTWTYVISYSGNVSLRDLVIEDDSGTPDEPTDDVQVCVLELLKPGGPLATCTLRDTATTGQYGNRGTVTGRPPGKLANVSAFDDSHYFGFVPEPAIRIEKLVNGQNADSEPGLYVRSGQAITWTYAVFNVGNVPLSAIQIVDDGGTPGEPSDDYEVCSFALLEAFNSEFCQLSSTAVEGAHTNVGTVVATYEEESLNVDDQDAAHYFGVTIDLTIEKLTNGIDADEPPGINLEPGDTVSWTYIVSNSSNVLLTDVVVWDDNGTSGFTGDDFVVCMANELEPGGQISCQDCGVAIAGQYGNVGTVRANSPLQVRELFSDRSHYHSFIWRFLPWLLKP